MVRPVIFRAALGATLAAAALGAQASTVVLSSWTFGSGNSVNASAPVYSGQAGGFSGTLDGNALQTYCVELTQTFNWSTPYTNYTDMSAASYFSGDKATKLGRLMSYVADTAGAVDTAAESTSLQLAVWNIVYDSDLSLSSHVGALFSDTSVYAGYANTLLAASQSWAESVNVYVLSSGTNQDQLHWNRNQVPEPASLALALLALGGAATASRRKRTA